MKDKIGYYEALITNVVDGDTCDCTISLFPHLKLENQRLRFIGVDTAEMKAQDPKEKAKANKAKDYTTKKLLNQTVVIKVTEQDVFGRHLVIIYLDGEDFNQHLLDSKIARPYVRGEHNER